MVDDSAYVGKHLLVGLTYVDHKNDVVSKVQLHGIITGISDEGIAFKQPNGEEFSLPPDIESLQPAPSGDYRLRATGEIVTDPDFIATWTITAPPPDEGELPC